MNLNKTLIAIAIAIVFTFNAYAYDNYSLFSDGIDQNLVTANSSRLVKLTKGDEVKAAYIYDDNGRITQRDYTDSTFDYTYNSDSTIKSARALMKRNPNSFIRHTKENFISEYMYDNEGKVIREDKRVFNDLDTNFEGVPKATYQIMYLYDNTGQLITRNQVLQSGELGVNLKVNYTYYDNGRLKDIQEIKASLESHKNTLLLKYYENGEIKQAIQTIFGSGIKTFDIEYVNDFYMIYGVYYVDPLKEWKVDMDFFGLSFHPIKKLTETVGDKIKSYDYTYQNDDSDFLADSLSLEFLSGDFKLNGEYKMINQP
ncbi:hypothetical protein AKG98_4145 [Moritella sp. JT01]|uniref:hypothetical protein n=1 Tax=Moritella sp. JT01 TaxID=756698 RepID=UPI0007976E01|nr:hypothetical protein [Moritella sp. JT01]KXO12946.1 hypothetical protein AKG98_4145 [Moritella sp. JT01]